MTFKLQTSAWNLVLAALLTSATPLLRAASPASAQKEQELIKIIESNAPPQDKAVPCKELAIYGSKNAVPALAALLPNPDLSSWARIALEAIPDPSASDALRDAMGKVQGRLLIGVINSIGFKRDAKATDALIAKLKEADVDVASAAAAALGNIGGEAAAKALTATLTANSPALRSEAAQGLVRCGEHLMAAGKNDAAAKLYDTVRKANLPKQRLLEATRGAILARGAGGVPLLLEQLRSTDKAFFGIGLSTARELPGQKVTQAIAGEMDKATPDRQALLLVLLADRADQAALPAITKAAKQGDKQARVAALVALEHVNSAAGLPAMLEAAADADPEIAQVAKTCISKLSAPTVDAEIVSALGKATSKNRKALIEVAGLRRIESALPIVAGCASDADPAVRGAAVTTLGAIGGEKQAGDLAKLLQSSQDEKERAGLEKALLALCSRAGAACLPHLLPLAQDKNKEVRKIALHTLSSVGGSQALAAITAAMQDADDSVQDEAVRTLSTWSSNWPEDPAVAEPLLKLAKEGKKEAHQVLGVRGYLQYLEDNNKLNAAEKVSKMQELLPLIKRAEEKRAAIPVISSIGTGGALELLLDCAKDQAIAEDAYVAIVNLAAKKDIKDASKDLRLKALQSVFDQSKEDRTRKRAQEAIKKI